MPVQLREYQEQAVQFMTHYGRAYLADDAGLGKTVTTLETLYRLDGAPALIIAPKFGLYTWRRELLRWYGEQSVVYTGKPHERQKAWEEFVLNGRNFLITNYAFVEEIAKLSAHTKRRWKAVVCDEIHMAGLLNRNTKTFARVKHLALDARHFFPITGTPIRKSPADLWAPLHLIDPRTFSSYWRFVYEHCMVIEDRFGKTIEPLPKNPMRLKQLLSRYMIRRRKQQVLHELPPKMRQPIFVEMTPTQEKIYNQLAEELIAEVGDDVIVAANEAVKILRLRQLLVTPKLLGIDDVGGALEVLPELIEDEFDNGRPAVVFTPFRQAIPIIEEYLTAKLSTKKEKLAVYKIMGSMDAEDMFDQATKFQNHPSPRRVLICSIKCSASFDAYAATAAFFLGCEWNATDNSQAEDRLHRFGQKGHVRAYYLMHKGSVDETLVAERLDEKEMAANWVLRPEEIIAALKNKKCPY